VNVSTQPPGGWPKNAPIGDESGQIFDPTGGETRMNLTDDRARGLYAKFNVMRTDGSSGPGEKHDGCPYFVLDLRHDPLALPALTAYAVAAQDAGYEQLAADLRMKYLGGARIARYTGDIEPEVLEIPVWEDR
jgi:hypothetical protein